MNDQNAEESFSKWKDENASQIKYLFGETKESLDCAMAWLEIAYMDGWDAAHLDTIAGGGGLKLF